MTNTYKKDPDQKEPTTEFMLKVCDTAIKGYKQEPEEYQIITKCYEKFKDLVLKQAPLVPIKLFINMNDYNIKCRCGRMLEDDFKYCPCCGFEIDRRRLL